jgi:hypothetical protein
MSDPLQIGRDQRSRVTKAVSVKQRTSRGALTEARYPLRYCGGEI